MTRIEKRLYWQQIMERHAPTELSVAEFCRQQQLSEAQFHYWSKCLTKHETRQTVIPLKLDEDITECTQTLQLTLQHGRTLSFPASINPARLALFVAALSA